MTRGLETFLLCALPLGLFACGGESPSSPVDPDPTPTQSETSYLRDIQPIIQRSCLGCHYKGGIAPLSFEEPTAVVAFASAIKVAVSDRRMPPFQAGLGCNDYAQDTRLPQAEIDLIAKWADEGGPMGEAAEERTGEPRTLPSIRPDIVVDAGDDFDAQVMRTDEYRCFVLDPKAETDLAVVAQDVLPDNDAIVHHVLAYAVAPENAQELLDKDAADPGLGYTCFGGPDVTGAALNQIAGWVPGRGAQRMPEGTALLLEAGSLIVMQVHYNLLAVPSGQPALDRTAVVLEVEPIGTRTLGRIFPLPKANLSISAGNANVVEEAAIQLPARTPTQKVYTVMGHMHMLGTRFRLDMTKAGGEEVCLLDIPRWDFNWQQTFELVRPVVVEGGDTIRIRCEYDNSAANQPIVDGQAQTPRDVTWGEGSLDEMCLGYVFVTQ